MNQALEPAELSRRLAERLNFVDLKWLCQAIGANWQDLGHSNRQDLALSLVEWAGQRQKMGQLIGHVRRRYPHVLEVRRVQVQILLEGDLPSFTREKQEALVDVLAGLLRVAPDNIRVLSVMSGSVLVTLEVPVEAAQRLGALHKAGRLDDFQGWKIKRVEIIEPKPPPNLLQRLLQLFKVIAAKVWELQRLLRKACFSTGQRAGAIWARHKTVICVSAILLTVVLVGTFSFDKLREMIWPSTPQISVEAFLITKGENPTVTVEPGKEITATVEEIVRIRVEVSTIGQEQEEDLLFIWYSCSKGPDPVLKRIGNPEMLYVAPGEPGQDCIRVAVEKGGVQLDKDEIFVSVRK